MDMFASLRAFASVVEKGAFARAARELGMSTSSLTRQVDALEEQLGTVLINRSTRRLTLTDAAAVYYEQALRILGDLEEANRGVAEMAGPPRGLLRVSMPVTFAQSHISPAIPDFIRLYPDIELDLQLSDVMVNLVEDRVDVAIRIGSLDSSSLVARRLAPQRRIVCASAAYLDARGEPHAPSDLARHHCLSFAYGRGDRGWRFMQGDTEELVQVSGPIRSNNSLLLRDAALAGCGIILMPTWLVGDDIGAGRLRPVLKEWEASPGSLDAAIHAVYLPSRRGSKKVRAFVDYLAGRFGAPPYWDRAPGLENMIG